MAHREVGSAKAFALSSKGIRGYDEMGFPILLPPPSNAGVPRCRGYNAVVPRLSGSMVILLMLAPGIVRRTCT